MPETLEELTQYIRETLPQPKSILHMRPMAEAEAVSFAWNGREFVVKNSLQALEIKNDRLFVTGASMLMQLALLRKNKNEKVLGVVVDNLRQAEELITNPMSRDRGFTLLSTVKGTLKRLIAQ
ncbi:MAG: hypothetical protein QG656_1205 [Candidatus Hydrogenedentes bacterium]|nr:hypothetical protein [Candidatus Hydrogenedentota bacterium]